MSRIRTSKLLSALLLSGLPVLSNAQFTFTTNNGAITITGYTGPGGAVTIPSSTNGLPVTRVEDNSLNGITKMTSITIPDSVTYIGYNSLEDCASLTNVTIGSGVTNIGDGAFYDCPRLRAITVDTNDPAYCSVAGVLFNKAQTTLITYPLAKPGSYYDITNSVIDVGDFAFSGCTNLTSITIPDSVSSIGGKAFVSCSLTNLAIPYSVTNIGVFAFAGSGKLAAIEADPLNGYFTSVEGVLFSKDQTRLVQYPAGKAGSYYSIPNGVTTLAAGAFDDSRLTSITIPSGVVSLGEGSTFASCTNLTKITIPNSVTNIYAYTFIGCSNLTSITIGSGVTNIGSEAFWDCTNLTGVYFQGNAPTGVSSAFYGDDNVKIYYLPGAEGWISFQINYRYPILWNPSVQIQKFSAAFRTNRFGFTVVFDEPFPFSASIIVEVCTNTASPVWSPVDTNTPSIYAGSYYFSDPAWTNYPSRFYRLRSPFGN